MIHARNGETDELAPVHAAWDDRVLTNLSRKSQTMTTPTNNIDRWRQAAQATADLQGCLVRLGIRGPIISRVIRHVDYAVAATCGVNADRLAERMDDQDAFAFATWDHRTRIEKALAGELELETREALRELDLEARIALAHQDEDGRLDHARVSAFEERRTAFEEQHPGVLP